MKSLSAACFAGALVFSVCAHAGWSITADAERFRWAESANPSVTETGPMFGIGARFAQDLPAGWQFGWRGRLYFGSVDYSGALLSTNEPITGTTEYKGLSNEGQAVYRFPGNPYGLEFVSGLIWDYWNRQLTPSQREQYWVGSLRLGLNADRRVPIGWFGGAGVKYPFYTNEDAHLADIGFNSNPRLKPKGALSTYAEAGYRFSPSWSLTGYYDSYRFKESNLTPTVFNPDIPDCAAGCGIFQPTSKVDSIGLRLQYNFQ